MCKLLLDGPRITSYNVCYTKLLRIDYMWPEEEVGEWKEIADCINRYQDVHDCELFKILSVKEATEYLSANVVVLFKKL